MFAISTFSAYHCSHSSPQNLFSFLLSSPLLFHLRSQCVHKLTPVRYLFFNLSFSSFNHTTIPLIFFFFFFAHIVHTVNNDSLSVFQSFFSLSGTMGIEPMNLLDHSLASCCIPTLPHPLFYVPLVSLRYNPHESSTFLLSL